MFIAKLVQVAIYTARALEGVVPIESVGGYGMLVAVGLIAVLATCFGAGIIAKRSIAQRFTDQIEKVSADRFP